jgi:hypothetical protein
MRRQVRRKGRGRIRVFGTVVLNWIDGFILVFLLSPMVNPAAAGLKEGEECPEKRPSPDPDLFGGPEF